MRLFYILLTLCSFIPFFLNATVFNQAPKDFKPKFEVVGCFLQYEDKILFLHRQDTASQGNLWGIPGGKIEKSESPKQAVIREISEETGFNIANEQIDYLDKVYIRYPDYDYVFHILKAKVSENPADVKLSFREHKGFTWVTPQDALSMNLMPDEDVIIKPKIALLQDHT